MRVAFRMKLHKGFEEEYIKRHDQIWADLKHLLHSKGVHEYSIFLDEQTGDLFGILHADDVAKIEELKQEPVMQKWWNFMKDIMSTNNDNSPVSTPLKEVFYFK